MKARFYYHTLIILTLCLHTFAQNQQFTPQLKVADKEVGLYEYHVKVDVVGNLAITTCEMLFYNNENRVLEGQLTFPLNDEQSVVRFALDVNGKLREGVPVEKNKGQQVFESIERKQVDPGLLEKVQGNVFRTRIYPIPAKGYRRVLIAYQQELENHDNNKFYSLPLFFDEKVKKFSIEVDVYNQEIKPEFKQNELENFRFEKWNESFIAKKEYEDIKLDHELIFQIPQKTKTPKIFVEKGKITGQNYFYFNIKPDQSKRIKPKSKSVTIAWDISESGKDREIDKEISLLKDYLTWLNEAEIKLVLFANDIMDEQTYKVKDGRCSSLFDVLNNIKYDGATQIGVLENYFLEENEILMFTDGLNTYGEEKSGKMNCSVTIINSNPSANHNLLKHISETSGGTYLNLRKLTPETAFENITSQPYVLLSVDYDDNIKDVYSSSSSSNPGTFSGAGILVKNNGSITLNFSYGNKIEESVTLEIKNDELLNTNMIERIWAQKKINTLEIYARDRVDEIRELGKRFSIVTENTSLIVLETVEDYVEYEIVPPDELREQYFSLIKNKKDEAINTEKENLEEAIQLYKEKIKWWETEYPLPPVKTDKRNFPPPPPSLPERSYSDNFKVVTGQVVNGAGEVFPSVKVSLRGREIETQTDEEGKFELNIPVNAILVFSFPEYIPVEVDVTSVVDVRVVLNHLIRDMEERDEYRPRSAARFEEFAGNVENDAIEIEDFSYSISEEESVGEDLLLAEVESKAAEPQKGAIFVKPWDPDRPYLDQLKKVSNDQVYEEYLKIKKEYREVPSFYIDVSDYFSKNGLQKEAIRIISNLAEIDLKNHELLRVLAHRLEQLGQYDQAIQIYKMVLDFRREEPQSYRDLALVMYANGDYQEAIDLMYQILKMHWDDRFPGIKEIVTTEMNAMINLCPEKVEIEKIHPDLIKNLPVDIRIVLNWDADNTDMDLWVTDPNKEKCFYEHKLTNIGGRLSNDFTGGYGPEEFMLKKAKNGKYVIESNYYGSRQQKIAGPVTIYLQLFTNYGKLNQEVREIIVQLSDNKEVIKIGEVEF